MLINEIVDSAYLESDTIEYKGIIKEGKDKDGKPLEIGWLKTLVAFSNTKGGTLFIGVEDKTHKVVALDQKCADNVILMVHRQIKEHIEPLIDYSISPIVIKDSEVLRYVIRVDVKVNKNLPVTLHYNGMLGIYVRNYGRTDLASQEQIRDMILMSDNTPFDTIFTDEEYKEDEYQILKKYLSLKNVDMTDKLLISKSFMSKDKKLSRGALLFKDNCDDLRTKIIMSSWPGVDKGGDVVNATEEYVGNLLIGIEKVQDFIENHSINGYKKQAYDRLAYYSYPTRSLTEGIVNAIGHRNYYIQGSQIEINIFRDRLEISSPGSLLGVRYLHEEKNISSIIPRRRNEVICSILQLCGLMEERGSGFDKIESDYAPYGEQFKPFVSSDASSFTLTLPDLTKNGVVSKSDDNPEVYVEVALKGKNDLNILSYCYNHARKVGEIADFIGVAPSTYFRKNVIDRLVKEGLLKEMNLSGIKKLTANKDKVFLK